MQDYFFPPIFPLAPWESFLVVVVNANHSKRHLFTSTAPQLWAGTYKLAQKSLAERYSGKPWVGFGSTAANLSLFAAAWWLLQILPEDPSPLLALRRVFQCPEAVPSTCAYLLTYSGGPGLLQLRHLHRTSAEGGSGSGTFQPLMFSHGINGFCWL